MFHPHNFCNTFGIADVILLSTVFKTASNILSPNGLGKWASSVKSFQYRYANVTVTVCIESFVNNPMLVQLFLLEMLQLTQHRIVVYLFRLVGIF